jgi:hypothetical protein
MPPVTYVAVRVPCPNCAHHNVIGQIAVELGNGPLGANHFRVEHRDSCPFESDLVTNAPISDDDFIVAAGPALIRRGLVPPPAPVQPTAGTNAEAGAEPATHQNGHNYPPPAA